MTVGRLSISLPPDVEERVRAAAERAGLPISAWVLRAAEDRVDHERALTDGRRAVEEFEAEFGALSPAARRRARTVLTELGVMPASTSSQDAVG